MMVVLRRGNWDTGTEGRLCEDREETANCKPKSGASEKNQPANALILTSSLRNCEKTFLLLKPPSLQYLGMAVFADSSKLIQASTVTLSIR